MCGVVEVNLGTRWRCMVSCTLRPPYPRYPLDRSGVGGGATAGLDVMAESETSADLLILVRIPSDQYYATVTA